MLLSIATVALFLSFFIVGFMGQHCQYQPIKAAVIFDNVNHVRGSILFIQDSFINPTFIFANIAGLSEGEHDIHIREYGDLTNSMVMGKPKPKCAKQP
jgi:Cu/Zn superoxide dismutase